MENHYSNTNTIKESSIIFGQNIIPSNAPFISNTIPNNNDAINDEYNTFDNLVEETKKKTNSTGVSSLNAFFQQGTEEGFLINEDQFLFQREEDLLVKDLMPHAEKNSEDKEKINKELLDTFLKKEKELLNKQKKTLLTSKKLSETIKCLNKLSEQAKYVLNLNSLKKKPKFIIDI